MSYKNSSPIFYTLAISILLSACSDQFVNPASPDDILWYKQPAMEWEQALPLGNGRLGVMVFGKTSNERIQLNDDSLWPADKGWDEPAGNAEDLKNIRALLFEGKNGEADKMFVEKFSRKKVVRSHQTLGDLFMDFDHQNITDYRRELNISKAISTVTYKTNGNLVTEKVLVSHPHHAIVIELSSEAPEGLNGQIRLTRPEDDGHATVEVITDDDDLLIMSGQVTQRTGFFNSEPDPILEGVAFETCLKIDHKDGQVIRGTDYLEVKNVKKATLYLVSNSSFYHDDFSGQNRKDLTSIAATPSEVLERDHIRDHQQFYNRVQFQLTNEVLSELPIDERLARIKKDSIDLGLETLLFQYGRYLLISSSRPGTNPANLQGLWNQHIVAPWNADYHLNINLQMNYWPANLTNLDELNLPLFDYIDRLVENGKVTAKKNFGCGGTFIPHATDLWAPTWLRAPTAYWGCSVGAGGWLMQHYWNHFEFTQDTNFLRDRAFPAMKAVANFYSDWIIEDPRDGTLISAPSTSPENRFLNVEGEQVATCLGSAMDQQVISEVFDNFISASNILELEDALLVKIKQQRQQLRAGFVLGKDNRILEWDREYDEPEPGHRHMSHLYGFHPGSCVSKDKTPEIFQAVRKTLDYRLANGGAGTGWSRAWLINCSARLLDGAMAHEHIQLLFQKSMYDNLFDGHPPFQIDGNFGYTSGIAEMLIQSHEKNTVRVLPALPPQWKEGHIKGLKARGGLTMDVYWKQNQLEKVIIEPAFDRAIHVIYEDQKVPVNLVSGEMYTFQP